MAAATIVAILATSQVLGATLIVVSGTITNRTSGGTLPEKLAVTAVQVNDEGSEVNRKQTESGPDGKFVVEGFDSSAGARLIVGTDYLGVTYSTLVEIPEHESNLVADLVIFETSEDDSAIAVQSDLITVVRGDEDNLEVIQLITISNSADRTFIGTASETGRQVVRLPVAPGAGELQPLDGFGVEGLSETAGGVATGEPLPPGQSQISYGYRVRVARSGWPMSRDVFYPTERVDLLVEKDLPVSPSEFRFEEQVTLEGKTYRRYRVGPLGAGAQIEATIGSTGSGSNLWWGLSGGFGALLLALLGGAFFARRRRAILSSPAERERLVQKVAELDEDFAAGLVDEPEYRKQREAMKAKLKDVTDRIASAGR